MNSIKPNTKKRFLAGFIDYTIIYIFNLTYIYAFGSPNEEGVHSISGFPALLPILFWGLVTVGFEQWFGATYGNQLVKLKPQSINGDRLSYAQSFKRHLLDPIDMFFFGVVGILLIKNTKHHQRLGDIWAKTVVVDNIE